MFTILLLILAALMLNRLTNGLVQRGLVHRQELTREVVEIGEPFALVTTMENRQWLPVAFCRLSETFPTAVTLTSEQPVTRSTEGTRYVQTMALLPWQRVRRTRGIACTARGRWMFQDATLEVGDLLGLTAFGRKMPTVLEVVALPRRADLALALEPWGNYYGDLSVRRWLIDDPLLTVGVVEYTGREPQRSIHWPSSLRAGRLMVRQYDYTTDNQAVIVLNIETAKPFWQNMDQPAIEECISLARSIAEEFELAGVPYGLTTNAWVPAGRLLHPGLGPGHLRHLLAALGAMDYGAMATFEDCLAALQRGETKFSTYIVVTPAIFQPYLDQFNGLLRMAPRLAIVSLDRRNLEGLDPAVPVFVGRDGRA